MANSSFKLYSSRNAFVKLKMYYSDCFSNGTKSSIDSVLWNIGHVKEAFFSKICSIKHIYDQTKTKISATSLKLKEETRKCRRLFELYKNIFFGVDNLYYIESAMKDFLGFCVVYERFLKTVACSSDRYSSYSDVLSYYISLNNAYHTLIQDYYNMLVSLKVYSYFSVVLSNRTFSQLYYSLRILDLYEIKIKNIDLTFKDILKKCLKVKFAGYNKSLEIIKTKYYIESILQDVIDLNYTQSDFNQPINVQINIIRNEILVLRLVFDKTRR